MKIHFIGIGGIGVSALAQYYLAKGHRVSGSDLVSSEITKALAEKGAKITIGKNLFKKDADLNIYSPAVNMRPRGANTMSYPEALGELTKEHFTIAVSGTHGKSTTTAMIGLILAKAGLDPTVIVGTKVREFCPSAGGSNCRVAAPEKRASPQGRGKSNLLVIEADEHFASFLNYWPKVIALTNLEGDHLDYYKNLGNIMKAFKKYVKHLPKNGVLVANKDDKNISKLKNQISKPQFKIKNYSLRQAEAKKLKKILKIPGEHNVSNALAALTVARVLKIPDNISFKALSGYRGSWRRFEERKLKIGNLKLRIVSDYGHHPTEIGATIKAAREKWPKKVIWLVFQPHQYQRTFYLLKDFINVFRKAMDSSWVDRVIITDIFDVAGREEKVIKKKINAQKLVNKIRKENVIYLPKEKILSHLKQNLKSGEVVIIMGAGNIYRLTDRFST